MGYLTAEEYVDAMPAEAQELVKMHSVYALYVHRVGFKQWLFLIDACQHPQ
jgi:hypothetical protein